MTDVETVPLESAYLLHYLTDRATPAASATSGAGGVTGGAGNGGTTGGGGGGEGFGSHPTDQLIRELVQTRRRATPREIEQIIERMATAPFTPDLVRVPSHERSLRYLGRYLGARADSLAYHLAKRVLVDRQWAEGTTEQQYLADLRRAVRAPSSRLLLYIRHGRFVAATITSTRRVLPPGRRNRRTRPRLLVVYLADRGIILTGYQFGALDALDVPEDALWLK